MMSAVTRPYRPLQSFDRHPYADQGTGRPQNIVEAHAAARINDRLLLGDLMKWSTSLTNIQ